jgi:membrane protein required for colicin V production
METHSILNTLDYVVLGIILLSGLLALMRGFIREVLSLAAWVGAYMVAAKYYPHAEPWVAKYTKNETAITVVASALIFCGALVVLSIIGYFIAKVVRGPAITAIDRSLGFVFGLLRGFLICAAVYLLVVSMRWPDIDKPHVETHAQNEATHESDKESKAKDAEENRNVPPEWLLSAHTRPALAWGANMLKAFLPEKELAHMTQSYTDDKATMQRKIDEQTLEMLSSPATAPQKDMRAPSYDGNSRSNLDHLINQKGQP